MKILYLHGVGAAPSRSVKTDPLRQAGHEEYVPTIFPEDSEGSESLGDEGEFQTAVWLSQSEYEGIGPEVVVRSSRGAAVAMALNMEVHTGLLLEGGPRTGKASL